MKFLRAARWVSRLLMPFLALLAGNIAAAEPARDGKVYRLLILDSQKGNPYDEVRAALLKTLADYGYVDGKNLHTTLQVIGNDIKEGERILKAENRQNHDVIFVGGTAATISAKNALFGDMSKRVVFGSPTDPIGIGVIKDFTSKPVANFTGVAFPVPPKARFKFIRQFLPKARTLGLIYADMPQSHSYNSWIRNLIATDSEFKEVKVIYRPVPLVTGENGDALMAAAAVAHIKELDTQVDAFIKPCDQLGTRRNFSEVVYKHASKPLIGMVQDDVMAHWGSTAVIYPSLTSIGEQAGRMIKDLFEGRKIADIVPEWPQKYGIAVDLPKARQFGISVPMEILQMAGENIVK